MSRSGQAPGSIPHVTETKNLRAEKFAPELDLSGRFQQRLTSGRGAAILPEPRLSWRVQCAREILMLANSDAGKPWCWNERAGPLPVSAGVAAGGFRQCGALYAGLGGAAGRCVQQNVSPFLAVRPIPRARHDIDIIIDLYRSLISTAGRLRRPALLPNMQSVGLGDRNGIDHAACLVAHLQHPAAVMPQSKPDAGDRIARSEQRFLPRSGIARELASGPVDDRVGPIPEIEVVTGHSTRLCLHNRQQAGST